MAQELSISELKEDLYRYLGERFDGLDARLDRLNGQTLKHAERIATLEERTSNGTRQGAVAGGIVAGIAALAEVARHWLMK